MKVKILYVGGPNDGATEEIEMGGGVETLRLAMAGTDKRAVYRRDWTVPGFVFRFAGYDEDHKK